MVYLIHFEPAYKHARHYLGYCEDSRLGKRIEEHEAGRGARLTQVAVGAGCFLEVVRLWPGASRRDERRMKRWRMAPRLCPICNPALHLEPPTTKEVYG
jgi:hypothetical protein